MSVSIRSSDLQPATPAMQVRGLSVLKLEYYIRLPYSAVRKTTDCLHRLGERDIQRLTQVECYAEFSGLRRNLSQTR